MRAVVYTRGGRASDFSPLGPAADINDLAREKSHPETQVTIMHGTRGTGEITPDRIAVARLLAGQGPVPGDEAAAALGWTTARWWDVVGRSGEWFDVTGRGWVLTEAGRTAFSGLPVARAE